jgi:hypothetical protein
MQVQVLTRHAQRKLLCRLQHLPTKSPSAHGSTEECKNSGSTGTYPQMLSEKLRDGPKTHQPGKATDIISEKRPSVMSLKEFTIFLSTPTANKICMSKQEEIQKNGMFKTQLLLHTKMD